MYELIFDEQVIKYLGKLPKLISKRIFNKIIDSKNDPHRYFEKLTNRSEYKLRVGNYRVIADIDDSKMLITVIYLNHRSKVYTKL